MGIFGSLTDLERHKLSRKLLSAGGQFATEFTELQRTPPDLFGPYQVPPRGPAAFLDACKEMMDLFDEVTP